MVGGTGDFNENGAYANLLADLVIPDLDRYPHKSEKSPVILLWSGLLYAKRT